ncbi:MAG: HD domain-containing protein [Candidatus Omnitrophica bacterium]|nr:HD domain-containing protein [Candidatus Omnitrophota bacterium]
MSTKNYLIHTKGYKLLISSLHSLYRIINSTFDMENLLLRLARLINQVLNSNNCHIILLDNSKRYSVIRCILAKKRKYFIAKKRKINSKNEKRIIDTSSSIMDDHLLGIPLIADDIIGMIFVSREKKFPSFNGKDQELLMILAEQSVIGIRNIQLYEEQQKIILGSIKSLIILLDTCIPQEYTHSPYFSRLVTAIAQEMKLDEAQIKSLQYASLFHDAGKVDVPLEILTKPTKLTPTEFKIIKKHPLKGAQIIKPLQVLRPVIPIIMHHHERYDGKGYPSKLKGNKIPLGARIMAIADAFEAMVYGRPYRERINVSKAIEEIKKKSGTQFDPKVVEAFLKAIKVLRYKKYLKLIK